MTILTEPDVLPNLLTILRILAAAFMPLALLFWPGQADWPLFGLFTFAALTDFLDGWLARRLKATTPLGAMLDPIADKLLLVMSFVALAAMYGPTWWLFIPAGLIMGREILISGLREYLGGRLQLPVTLMAKWKTTVQLVALGLILLAGAMKSGPVMQAGQVLLWAAVVLTLITGADYLRKAMPLLTGREAPQ